MKIAPIFDVPDTCPKCGHKPLRTESICPKCGHCVICQWPQDSSPEPDFQLAGRKSSGGYS